MYTLLLLAIFCDLIKSAPVPYSSPASSSNVAEFDGYNTNSRDNDSNIDERLNNTGFEGTYVSKGIIGANHTVIDYSNVPEDIGSIYSNASVAPDDDADNSGYSSGDELSDAGSNISDDTLFDADDEANNSGDELSDAGSNGSDNESNDSGYVADDEADDGADWGDEDPLIGSGSDDSGYYSGL